MQRSHQPSGSQVSTHRSSGSGTVVAPHERSVKAGLRALDEGGNAVDAAVAAALVAGVIEPTETTLAGSGFMLVHQPDGTAWSIDFGPRAPIGAHAHMYTVDHASEGSASLGLAGVTNNENVDGPRANGVPRTFLGLITGHEKFGSLDRSTVMSDAIEAAYEGFPADVWFKSVALADVRRLRSDPMASQVFLDVHGLPLGASNGDSYGLSFESRSAIVQTQLGETLERVARDGAESLTCGSVARDLVRTSTELGGLLTMEDMRHAAPTVGKPLRISYRDTDVWFPPAPGGGLTEAQILRTWEALNSTPSSSHESSLQTRLLVLAVRSSFADRYHWLGDQERIQVPQKGLLSREYAQSVAGQLRRDGAVEDWSKGAPWITYSSFAANNPWKFDDAHEVPPKWTPETASTPSSGTTHISVVDATGMAVAITHTAANPFGSGIVCPRSGLLFDSAMAWFNAAAGAANSIASGSRALANMGPAILSKDGQTIAALGASGGRRIISCVAQIIINLVDGRASFEEALSWPRIDASGPETLIDERRELFGDDLEGLNPRVIPVSNEPFTPDFARPNIAGLDLGQLTSAITTSHYND